MADNSVALTTIRGGINRQRTKGGAPEDALYDLLNAYVTKSKNVVPRPGTARVYDLGENTAAESPTRGLVSYNGGLHTFCHKFVDLPVGVTLHIITHPDQTPEDLIPIEEINFASPFMGYLYVAATFTNGDCFHFWLQEGAAWQADTAYELGDIVIPTATEFAGLAFQAQRLTDPNPAWQASVERALNDVIEPTEYNGFYYTVVEVQGTNPRSGTVEPEWPTEDGAQVVEDADGTDPTPPALTAVPDTSAVPSPSIANRYRNRIPS